MKSIKETLELLEQNIKALNEFDLVSLEQAKERFLAKDIKVKKNLPSFDNSALDGYAFNYEDKDNALSIKGTIFAGDKNTYILGKNECYKIMTGAKIPQNADTILMLEDENLEQGKLVIKNCPKRFNAVRLKGEELKSGDMLLRKGEILNAAKIALLASQGIYKIEVCRKIRVGIFSSGNELKEPWQECDDMQIYNTNAFALLAMFSKNAFELSYLGIINDDLKSTKKALKDTKFDLLLTSGGASVGEADFMRQALLELDFKPLFEGVKAKMAKPTKLYQKENHFALILPGNPLSAFLSCFLFGLKLAFLLSGNLGRVREFHAKMASEVRLKSGRDNLILGSVQNGKFNPAKTSPAMLSPLLENEFLLIVAADKEYLKENEEVKLIKIS